jgi:hypothetical protein
MASAIVGAGPGERHVTLSPDVKARLLSFVASMRHGKGAATGIHRAVLYTVYGGDIATRLARIHAHPARDRPNGTLVVALRGRKPAFVRCAFANNGDTLLCETVSGEYPPEPDARSPAISTAMEEGLRKAGYWRDEGGCAVATLDVSAGGSDWGGASVSILTPLIDVFGASPESKIDIIAPLAPERDEAAIRRMIAGQS